MSNRRLYLSGVALIAASMIANVINMAFNLYLGRTLSLADFGELSFFMSLVYFSSIPLGTYSGTNAHTIARLAGKKSDAYARGYFVQMFRRTIVYGGILTVIWFLATPFLERFFQSHTPFLVAFFAPVWLISLISSNFSGYLKGLLAFEKVSVMAVIEAGSRFLFAWIFILWGKPEYAFIAIVLSLFIDMLMGWWFVRSGNVESISDEDKKFNTSFFIASLVNGISVIAFLSVDVMLVKHYLSPDAAGEYGLLSLVGKMTFFLGSLLAPFMIPLVSHNEGANKRSRKTFILLFATTFAFCFAAVLFFGLFGPLVLPLLFGEKVNGILPLLLPYVTAMALFTLTQPLVNFYQAKQVYSLAFAGVLVLGAQVILMALFHANIAQIVWVMVTVSIGNFLGMGLLSILHRRGGLSRILGKRKKRLSPSEKKHLDIVYLDFDDIRNPLLAAGQATATYEVARRLVKRGHRVTVLCSRYPGYKDRKEKGVFYKHIGLGSKNIKLNNAIYFFSIPFAVLRIRGDIIIECFTAPISTLFSPIFTKIPVVVLPSMFNAHEFSEKYGFPFHHIERFGVQFYKYMMPYSEIDRAKIRSMNSKIETRIIPQGVGDEYLSLKRKKSEYILFLGRFDIAQKGIDLLLRAYAKRRQEIKYPLIIAGHGPDQDKIEKLIQDLDLTSNVTIAGPLYGDNKLDVMSRAAFVAFPSRHDELSLWALEALGAALPLVIFDLPESAWMGNDCVLRARPYSISEYADLLITASHESVNAKMSSAARTLAQTYSWDTVVNQIEKFVLEIISRTKNSQKQ